MTGIVMGLMNRLWALGEEWSSDRGGTNRVGLHSTVRCNVWEGRLEVPKMINKMEKYVHNPNRVSLKDFDGDIDIRQKKWDFLFDFILKQSPVIYFRGTRLEFQDDNLKSNIALLRDQNIGLFEEDYFRVFFKVKESFISIGRGLIDNVWAHYEYPCIIFLKEELRSNNLRRLFEARYYEDVFAIIEGAYLVYKSFEPDVLWVEKTMDMDFPPELIIG